MSATQPAVRVDHVSKAFGAKRVLDDLSFDVSKGTSFCLLGKSGTGKSVTLKHIIGLLKPDRGRVMVDGKEIGAMDRPALLEARRQIGFVFQAGTIAGIDIPSGPGKFRLRLQIRRDLNPLVRADSVASIKTEGLVGKTFLELSTGSPSAAAAAPRSTIPSREPVTFGDMVQQVGETVGTINDTVLAVRADLHTAVKSVAGAADRAGSAVGDIGKAASNLSENAEALKHNFLFKGFFKDRGYFDLESISPIDYRHGALATKGRAVLRTWLPADTVFARGGETLSPGGRTRLDAAMGEWMQFRGEGPLVVEGYSTAATPHAQYLASQARAAAVRTYLVQRFSLDPKSTGAFALGAEAPGSPRGDVFDGVALALYLDRKTLDEARRPKATSGR